MPAQNGSGDSETRFSESDSLLGGFMKTKELIKHFFYQIIHTCQTIGLKLKFLSYDHFKFCRFCRFCQFSEIMKISCST